MTDEELRRAEHRLLAGAATYACGGYIVRLDALHRNDLYTRLAYDRLERKYDVVRDSSPRATATGTRPSTSCCSARSAT